MVALTLLCTAILSEALLYKSGYEPAYDFYIQPVNGHYTSYHYYGDLHFASKEPQENVLTDQDIQQIRAIPNVASVSVTTSADILLELREDTVPQYFRDYYTEERDICSVGPDGAATASHAYTFHNAVSPFIYTESLAYLLEDTSDRVTDLDQEYLEWNAKTFQEMQAARRGLGAQGKLIPLTIEVMDVSNPDFQKELKEGRINLAALDAGQEVLVFAPEMGFWETEEHGENVGNIASADFGKDHPNARLKGIAINDYFTAGQSLQLIQALTEDEGENWDRTSAPFTQAEAEALEQSYRSLRLDTASVTVGAVLESASAVSNGLRLITTEKGLRALGFAPTDPTFINVSLTGEVDRETEEAIQRRLETIAARAGMEVYNRMENARENARRNRQIELVFLGIIVLFFAVSVSMQVSGASRRIRADKRMIGTLRAVGADEGELMGCYRLPVLAATAAGLLLALIIFTLMGVFYSNYFHTRHAAVTMPLMAALCALCCMAGVRGRLRQILSKSVVENIREL